jgi:hypothetical protein
LGQARRLHRRLLPNILCWYNYLKIHWEL